MRTGRPGTLAVGALRVEALAVGTALLAGLLMACAGGRGPAGGPGPGGPGPGRPGATAGRPAPPEVKPRCGMRPGRVPDGFVLAGTEDLDEGDHVGVRREYRDPAGRLLVYLLGIAGEVGEGATVVEEHRLADGSTARLLGDRGGPNWALVWDLPPPCRQAAVVGNGMTRREFTGLMQEAGVLASPR